MRTDIVVDIGRSVNPSVDIGQVRCVFSSSFPPLSPCWLPSSPPSLQIEGAFMQGLGLYTLEELKFSPSGLLYTRGPSQYKIPAVCDVPLRFNVYLLPDSHNPHAIYSSKVRGHDARMYILLFFNLLSLHDTTRLISLMKLVEWCLFLFFPDLATTSSFTWSVSLQGIGEPVLFLGSSVFFAIKDAVAAARSEVGLIGPFPLDSPATAERICLGCSSPFTQKVKLLK